MAFPGHTPKSELTVVASATTPVTLVGGNSHRRGATIFNDSTSVLYIKYGDLVTTTNYSAQLRPGGYLEAPYIYSGPITGVWASVNGSAYITEIF